MAKIDKSKYTKAQWKKIKEQRQVDKENDRQRKAIQKSIELRDQEELPRNDTTDIAFVLGNGTSRKPILVENLSKYGKVYGCNALYRSFSPDYLIAVDVKMILEINKAGYQHKHEVWTNPNKTFNTIKNLNFFHPSKGWSSGPTALWLATKHRYKKIFILGFDFKGVNDGKSFNNIYADTNNYKKSTDGATFFGNWMRQTRSVIQTNPQTEYVRVIQPDNYKPEELNTFDNFSTIFIEDFQKIFNI